MLTPESAGICRLTAFLFDGDNPSFSIFIHRKLERVAWLRICNMRRFGGRFSTPKSPTSPVGCIKNEKGGLTPKLADNCHCKWSLPSMLRGFIGVSKLPPRCVSMWPCNRLETCSGGLRLQPTVAGWAPTTGWPQRDSASSKDGQTDDCLQVRTTFYPQFIFKIHYSSVAARFYPAEPSNIKFTFAKLIQNDGNDIYCKTVFLNKFFHC